MLRNSVIAAVASVALALPAATFAEAQFGTAPEAKAMLERAVAALKANEAAALQAFNSGEGGFKDRDLYVFCFDVNTRKFTAHGSVKSLVGTDLKDLKEKDGTPLGDKLLNSAKSGTFSSVSYKWPRPGLGESVAKESYVTRVGDQGCGVGYYRAR